MSSTRLTEGPNPTGRLLPPRPLDNAATTQKPWAVIDAVARFYERDCSNIHRGVHELSQRATAAFEGARQTVARFIGAASPAEVIFTRGATEAINLAAHGLGAALEVGPGDEVLITHLEHHSNIVPWQLLCERTGAHLQVARIDDHGALDLEDLEAKLCDRTRLVSLAHVSNALGTLVPVADVARLAHERGVPVLVDGAQALGHEVVDVAALGCDLYACSAHKAYGPTGVGALWGRRDLLERMPPWQGGGDMIREVTFARTSYADLPARLEAGTPNVAGVIGLGAALRWLDALGREAVVAHEAALLEQATRRLGEIEGLRVIGTAPHKTAVVSFAIEGAHPHDLGTALDHEGIAVRTGHHCAQPVMARFGLPATTRASFAVYNTADEVDALVAAVRRARRLLVR